MNAKVIPIYSTQLKRLRKKLNAVFRNTVSPSHVNAVFIDIANFIKEMCIPYPAPMEYFVAVPSPLRVGVAMGGMEYSEITKKRFLLVCVHPDFYEYREE